MQGDVVSSIITKDHTLQHWYSFIQNSSCKRRNFGTAQTNGETLWKEENFFDQFAISKDFNPLDSEKWYFISKKEVKSAGGLGILEYYNGSHIRAITQLYPELMLQGEKFLNSHTRSRGGNWRDPQARRVFFDNFATSRLFSPLDAEKWCSISRKDILTAGGSGILEYYKKSHFNALKELYPELKLQNRFFPNYRVKKQSAMMDWSRKSAQTRNFHFQKSTSALWREYNLDWNLRPKHHDKTIAQRLLGKKSLASWTENIHHQPTRWEFWSLQQRRLWVCPHLAQESSW